MTNLWPVYEFRPLPQHSGAMVLRYAGGEWLPDDGEWDIAFVSYMGCAPYGLGVNLPYQRNIVWSGLTTHWRGHQARHPRGGNPWHYMLRAGQTEWGGDWGRDAHLNTRAYEAAMNKCCSLNRCANGRGPEFKLGDPYVAAGFLRDRETKEVVKFPEPPHCMYCGDGWAAQIAAKLAEVAA